jgi:chorismate mutase
MTTEIGRLINVGIGRETARGTAQASATFWIPKVDFDFNPRADVVVNESGLGVIDGRSDAKVVEKVGEGSFGGIVYDKNFGLLLAACLGTWSTGVVTDSAYTHTFTRLNTNQHPALTIFHKDQNLDEKFALAMLNQLTINCALKDFVRYTAGFLSKVGSDTSSTPSYTAENEFLASHVTVKFAATTAALATASATAVRAVNLTINKNVEDLMNLGAVEPSDIVNKALTVSGDLELVFDDDTVRDYVTNGTKKAALITINNTDVLIGTASRPKLEITLAPMSFRDWGRGAGQNDVVTQTVAFDGNFGLTDSKTLSIALTNAQTSY